MSAQASPAIIDGIANINSTWAYMYTNSELTSGKIDVYIYDGVQGSKAAANVALTQSGSRPAEPTYTLQASGVTSNGQRLVRFELAPLVKDFIQSDVFNSYSGQNTVWVDTQATITQGGVEYIQASTAHLAVDGYDYAIETTSINDSIMLDGTTLHILEDQAAYIPVKRSDVTAYDFKKDGVSVKTNLTNEFDSSSNNYDQIIYISNSDSVVSLYTARVLDDSGIFENNELLSAYDTIPVIYPADEVVITHDLNGSSVDTTIKLNNVCEHRFTPKKLTFVNRHGQYQDLWMFKNSKRGLDIKSEEHNRSVQSITSGFTTSYRPTTVRRNTSVKEKMTLNSGFYPESDNYLFEQLMQANDVWMWNDTYTQAYPVLVSNGSFNFKDSFTDKMINYTIDVKYAFDKVVKIR